MPRLQQWLAQGVCLHGLVLGPLCRPSNPTFDVCRLKLVTFILLHAPWIRTSIYLVSFIESYGSTWRDNREPSSYSRLSFPYCRSGWTFCMWK
ncbi:hypothetical protein GGR50DRAFT_314416 [Xylaria sp. CBS 124048]|nr:hypothetical protein GGR50DRAFT_314416 [Xylaria sp. CBS 124048]